MGSAGGLDGVTLWDFGWSVLVSLVRNVTLEVLVVLFSVDAEACVACSFSLDWRLRRIWQNCMSA